MIFVNPDGPFKQGIVKLLILISKFKQEKSPNYTRSK